jgi:hypothetical protein
VSIIGISGYLLATGVEIPGQFWPVVMLVLGAVFGVEAITKFIQSRNGK